MSRIISLTKSLTDTEMTLLEIQASLTHTIETKFNFLHLGKLTQINEDNFMLNIGNHQILGKRVMLKNPILVCSKHKDQTNPEIKVLKVIRSKVLFNSRPTPILTAPPKK